MKTFHRQPQRRGMILLYSLYLMMMMCAIVSVAVDYGRIQAIKTEEQRCADATARGVLTACMADHTHFGYSTSLGMLQALGPTVAGILTAKNPVDPASGIAATYTTTIGSYYGGAFVADNGAHGPSAVKVIVSRAAVNGNAVPLAFPLPSGNGMLSQKSDVWASSIAVLPNTITLGLSETVLATYDPWLAGQSTGATASYDDAAPGQSPLALNVIPGATLTVTTAVTGTVQHGSATGLDGPDGNTSAMYWHMKDPPAGSVASGQGAENYIGDIITPIDSLTGVFLDNNAPSSANAPATVRDYTSQASRDNPDFTNLQLQQPFYIGDGVNSTGTDASFLVPAQATRFYLGIMDGYEWKNNSGSFTVSFVEQPPITLVQ